MEAGLGCLFRDWFWACFSMSLVAGLIFGTMSRDLRSLSCGHALSKSDSKLGSSIRKVPGRRSGLPSLLRLRNNHSAYTLCADSNKCRAQEARQGRIQEAQGGLSNPELKQCFFWSHAQHAWNSKLRPPPRYWEPKFARKCGAIRGVIDICPKGSQRHSR